MTDLAILAKNLADLTAGVRQSVLKLSDIGQNMEELGRLLRSVPITPPPTPNPNPPVTPPVPVDPPIVPPVTPPAPNINDKAIKVAPPLADGADSTHLFRAAIDEWKKNPGKYITAEGDYTVDQIQLPEGRDLVVDGNGRCMLKGDFVDAKEIPVGNPAVDSYTIVRQVRRSTSPRATPQGILKKGQDRIRVSLPGAKVGDMLEIRTSRTMYGYSIGHVAMITYVDNDEIGFDTPLLYELDPVAHDVTAQSWKCLTGFRWIGMGVTCRHNAGQYGMVLTHAHKADIINARFEGNPRRQTSNSVNHIGLGIQRGIDVDIDRLQSNGFLEPRSWGYGAQLSGHRILLHDSNFAWNKHSVAGGYGTHVGTDLTYRRLYVYGTIVVALDVHGDIHSSVIENCTVDIGDPKYGSTYGSWGGLNARGPNCRVRNFTVNVKANPSKCKGIVVSGAYDQDFEDIKFNGGLAYGFRMDEGSWISESKLRNVKGDGNVEVMVRRQARDRVDMDDTVTGYKVKEQVV